MRRSFIQALILLASTSSVLQAGVPAFVTYSGRLTDGTGWGESTEATLVFNLYDAADAQDPFWTTTHPDVAVVDGYFTVNLGMCNEDGSVCTVNPAEATFPADLPDQPWVGVEVGGVELVRQPVGSVPFAVRATRAEEAPGPIRRLVMSIPVELVGTAGGASAQLAILKGATEGFSAALGSPAPGTERQVSISVAYSNSAENCPDAFQVYLADSPAQGKICGMSLPSMGDDPGTHGKTSWGVADCGTGWNFTDELLLKAQRLGGCDEGSIWVKSAMVIVEDVLP